MGSLTEPNLNDIDTALAKQKTGVAGRQAGFAADENAFTGKYSSAINSQEALPAMYKRIGDELNLPTLQANAQSLNQTVRDLPQTYSAATRGFDVNANQLSRIVGQKSSELAPALATANEALGTAQGNLNTRMGFEQADQERLLKPLGVEQQMLSERIARENTAYSQEDQNELNGLLQKMQMGVTLSEGEKNRAAQLAQSEQSYHLEQQKMQASQSQNNQIIEVGGQKYLINPQTGQIVSKYGASGGTTVNKDQFHEKASVDTGAAQTSTNPQTIAPTWQGSSSTQAPLSGGLWGWLIGGQ